MAFEQKEWLDRVSEFPMRRQLTDEDGNVELVTLERADGEVSTEGDAFSASNMNDLEQRVADAFGSIDLTATAISYNDSSTSLGASNVQGAIEKLKKFVSDGKSKIASAITGQGVSTSADATFATMSSNIATAGNNRYNNGYNSGYNTAKPSTSVIAHTTGTYSVNVTSGYTYAVALSIQQGYQHDCNPAFSSGGTLLAQTNSVRSYSGNETAERNRTRLFIIKATSGKLTFTSTSTRQSDGYVTMLCCKIANV